MTLQINQKKTASVKSIIAIVCGIIVFLMILTESQGKWSREAVIGGVALSLPAIILGFMSLIQKEHGKALAITGLILGVLSLLVSLGSI